MTVLPGNHDTSLVLDIMGMSCDHCIARVRKALAGVAGVGDSDVRVGSARVEFDSAAVSADDIAAAVTRAGYPATVAGTAA